MKNRLLISLAILSLAGVFAACGDDSGGSGNGADAGPRADAAPRPDGAPTVATCGIVAGNLGDGVTVIFSNPDGSFIGTAITDSEGAASRDDCVTGTMLTLVLNNLGGGETYHRLYTFAGVDPGDTVMSATDSDLGGSPTPLDVNVTTSSDTSALTDTASYATVLTGCDDDDVDIGGTANLSATDGCLNPAGKVDVLAFARNAGDYNIGYAVATDLDLPAEVTLPAWSTMVNAPATLEVTGLPASANEYAFAALVLGRAFVPFTEGEIELDPSGGTLELERLPPGFGDYAYVTAGAESYNGGDLYSAWGFARNQGYADDTSVDFAASTLPRISGVLATAADPSRPIVSWFADGDLGETTVVAVGFDFEGELSYTDWFYVGPGTGTSIQFPALPDALASLGPDAGSELEVWQVTVADASFLTYKEAITSGIEFEPLELDRSDSAPPLPPVADADVRWTTWERD